MALGSRVRENIQRDDSDGDDDDDELRATQRSLMMHELCLKVFSSRSVRLRTRTKMKRSQFSVDQKQFLMKQSFSQKFQFVL